MRTRTSPTRIASILRDIRADLDAGLNVNQACRKAGIAVTTYYRWKALQESPISNEQLRLSELEAEVDRLKLLVAELALDRRMLQEALKKTRMANSTGRWQISKHFCLLSISASPQRWSNSEKIDVFSYIPRRLQLSLPS